MIRITKHTPPVFEMEIKGERTTRTIIVYAEWFSARNGDYAKDRLQTSVDRYPEARDLNYWLGLWEYSLLSLSETSELDEITSQLTARQSDIVRYLWTRPKGVTFSEFMDHREQGRALTESADPYNVAAMLRKLSAKLAKFGWKIHAGERENLIILERRENNSQV